MKMISNFIVLCFVSSSALLLGCTTIVSAQAKNSIKNAKASPVRHKSAARSFKSVKKFHGETCSVYTAEACRALLQPGRFFGYLKDVYPENVIIRLFLAGSDKKLELMADMVDSVGRYSDDWASVIFAVRSLPLSHRDSILTHVTCAKRLISDKWVDMVLNNEARQYKMQTELMFWDLFEFALELSE